MKLLHLLLFLLVISVNSFAQGVSVDSLMHAARQHLETELYSRALHDVNLILSTYPKNEDALVFKGNIHNWTGDYPAAIEVLKPLSDRDNPNMDALRSLINTLQWSKNYEKCIEYCNRYLEIVPSSQDVALVKANCLEQLNRDDDAIAVLNSITLADSNNPGIAALKALIGKKAKNTFSASYLNISTYNPGQSPFHYGYLEYTRKFNASTVVGRANAGNAFDETEMLFEADYYRTFSRRDYLYLNAGVSTGKAVFPVARAGAEYYFVAHKNFDYSLGFRYMHFETEDVALVTGHFGYNSGTYTLAYRPFYDTANNLLSHVVSLQKSNEIKEQLIRLELQYGNVPYLYLYNSFTEPLVAYRAGLNYQHRFGNSFFIRPVFLYEYEEYLPEMFRHRFNVQVILTKRF